MKDKINQRLAPLKTSSIIPLLLVGNRNGVCAADLQKIGGGSARSNTKSPVFTNMEPIHSACDELSLDMHLAV